MTLQIATPFVTPDGLTSTNALMTQLFNMVVFETNRPDLIYETIQAIGEAIYSAHLSDFYYKDITVVQTTFSTADYIQTIDTTMISGFRSYAFFRKAVPGPTNYQPMSGSISDPLIPDPVTGSYSYPLDEYVFLTERAPDDLLDDYGYELVDIYYQAGTAINIKSSTSIVNGQFGYYTFPNIDILNYGQGLVSWIASSYPYLIVYKAAASIFQKIGQMAAVDNYMNPQTGKYFEQLAAFKLANIVASGF